jgi:hypothetical protein
VTDVRLGNGQNGQTDDDDRPRPAPWLAALLVGLVVWYVATLAFWAVRPLDDSVPTVAVGSPTNLIAPSQSVQCDSPLSGSHEPKEALPELEPIQGFERVYARPACATPVENANRLLLADTAITLVGVLVLIYLRSRRDIFVAPAKPAIS